jgi:RNA polymerase primary sigma factor/RNA polymerase sigma factor
VLIQAVAAYNPWIGIRFSTYAYTCLIRALHRQSQRQMKDRLSHCLSLDSLADAPPNRFDHTLVSTGSLRIEEYLKADHPLLTHREKFVITRRFIQAEETPHTLEKVGEALGLSKERVRQVQASALTKLRLALAETAST